MKKLNMICKNCKSILSLKINKKRNYDRQNFFAKKKLIYWCTNLINNESGTGKLNSQFYSNDVKRCNIASNSNSNSNSYSYSYINSNNIAYKLQLRSSHCESPKLWKNAWRSYDKSQIKRKSDLI